MRITINHLHSHQIEMMELLHKLGNNNLKFKKQIMAKIEEVKQALADLQTSVDTNQEQVIARIQELKDQIGAGGTITEADLDGLVATVQNIQSDVDTTDEG